MSKKDSKIKSTDIAIIGLGCWYPGAKNIVELWENVLAKRQQFRRMLDGRLPLGTYYHPDKKVPDKTYAQKAAFIEGFEFDWNQNRFPKKAFESTDIVQWLALDVAHKAINDAKLSKDTIPLSKTGVIVGNSLAGEVSRANALRLRWPYFEKIIREAAEVRGMQNPDLDELLKFSEKICKDSLAEVTEDSLAGSLANTIAGRICNYFDLDGGGFTVDGACASSLLAVANGASALASGDLDLALVGGVDVSIDTVEVIGFAKVGALAENKMKVFDRDGRGFIPGEGCGFAVLKRLDDAVASNDKVYAVLKGWGISSDGSGGITAPKATGQAKAIARAYEKAGYTIADCQFIEGHGTGTAVGDSREIEALSLAAKETGKAKKRSIGVTSVKSILGHTKAAAGIGAFIKASMGVNRRIAPPTSGCEQPNAIFDQQAVELFPLTEGIRYRSNKKMRAGISSFGFGGINCHLTIESYKEPLDSLEPSLPEDELIASSSDCELFLFSAQSVAKLKSDIERVSLDAPHMSVAELTDMAASLASSTSSDMPFRAAVIASEPTELDEKLKTLLSLMDKIPAEGKYIHDESQTIWLANKTTNPKTAFIFTGQGSQRINMAYSLYSRFDWAKSLVNQANSVLRKSLEGNLSDYFFKNRTRAKDLDEVNQWKESLKATFVAQPALCLSSTLWAHRLKELGVQADVVAGHSLGELTALHWAGAYDFSELINLASTRGRLMMGEDENRGTMLSMSCSREQVEMMLEENASKVEIANINSPEQTVVSGSSRHIKKLAEFASYRGIACQELDVSNAFHSSFVSQASENFKSHINLPEGMPELKYQFLSGVENCNFEEEKSLGDYLSSQIRKPVDLIRLTEKLKAKCDLIIEVGPGHVLADLLRAQVFDKNIKIFSTESQIGKEFNFNQVIAAYFAMGGDVRANKLFSNRLTRAYIPFSDKVFITNPCEKPLMYNGESLESFKSKSVQIVAAQPASLQDAQKRQMPNVEIKVDSPASQTTEVPAEAKVIPMTAPQNNQTSNQMGFEGVKQVLYDVLVDITGFSSDSFSMEMRLLDDLNLDSIKAGQVISEVTDLCAVSVEQVDPVQFANASLEDIINMIVSLNPIQSVQTETFEMPQAVGAEFVRASEPAVVPSVVNRMKDSPAPTPAKMPSVLEPQVFEEPDVESVPVAQSALTVLFEILAKSTGFDPSILSADMRLLDDLNLDSIKAGEVINQMTGHFPNSGEIDPIQFANATIEDIANFFAQSEGSIKKVVEYTSSEVSPRVDKPSSSQPLPFCQELMHEVSKVSGISMDFLNENQDPVADLHLSSNLITEIMMKLYKKNGVSFDVDPERLLGKSFVQLAQVTNNIVSQKNTPKPSTFQFPKNEGTPWVRNFKTRLVKKERESHDVFTSRRLSDDFSKARVLIVYDEESVFVEETKQKLIDMGSICKVIKFAEINYLSKKLLSEFSYVLFFQPINLKRNRSELERLRSTVGYLHFLANLPRPEKNPRRLTTIACIQFGDGFFGHGEFVQNYTLTAYPSFFQTVHIERPEIRVRCIDMSVALKGKMVADEIIAEITNREPFTASCFDAQGVRRELIAEVTDPRKYNPRKVNWQSSDVVVVTGGGKGITAECALAFARKHKTKLALVGSSSHPGPLEQADQSSELVQNLKRFKEAGIEANYYSCNVSSAAAVRELVDTIQKDLGDVTGVIHGAGKNKPRRISQVSVPEAIDEISPKILGMTNLIEALDCEKLKLVSAFTSIIGVQGVPGNAWYAMANHALYSIVEELKKKHRSLHGICFAYSLWEEVGMAAKLGSSEKMASTGVRTIPLKDGIERFMQLIEEDPGVRQIIITSRPWASPFFSQTSFENKNYRFLKDIGSFTSGVEVISEAELTLESDLYLRDHQFSGSYLFPAVMGMEAMAQCTAFLMGRDSIESVIFEDLQFKSAISVKDGGSTKIRIHAIKREDLEKTGDFVVDVKITSSLSNFSKVHFAGTVVIPESLSSENQPVLNCEQALAINPVEDLYGPILFHGPTYQRLGEIYNLSGDEIEFSVEQKASDFNQNVSFKNADNQFILGDPFYRDALLQSQLVVCSDLVVLPIFCKRLEIYRPHAENRTLFGHGQLVGKTSKSIRFEISSQDEDGRPIERYFGAEGVIIKKRDENAGKNLAIDSADEDLNIFQHKSNKILPTDCNVVVEFRQDPGFSQFNKEKRHAVEKELFEKCVEGLSPDEKSLTLRWNTQGKPFIEGSSDLHVSFTTYEDYCLCALGDRALGVDLEGVNKRSKEDWKSLLGPTYSKIFQDLCQKIDDIDLAGTIIWSAREAGFKASQGKDFVFNEFDKQNGAVKFNFEHEGRHYFVVSEQVKLMGHVRAIYSQSFEGTEPASSQSNLLVDESGNYMAGLDLEKGFVIRWPINFKDAASPKRNLYFSKFGEWQGRAREIAIWPLLEEAAQIFKKGDYGWVTNHSETQIFASATVGDILEVRISSSPLMGKEKSTVELIYDWFRVDKGGIETPIAQSRMQVTWVEIIGHGKVKVAPFPQSFLEFFSSVASQGDSKGSHGVSSQLMGPVLFEAPNGPNQEVFLADHVFSTTLEDSNLVGNIYFSNYMVWQGRTRDSYLQTIVPDIFDLEKLGEAFTTRVHIKHLRELMPFEKVHVEMKLKKIYQNGLSLYFEYFKYEDGVKGEKLAFAEHELIWAESSRDQMKPAKLPDLLVYHLKLAVEKQGRKAG